MSKRDYAKMLPQCSKRPFERGGPLAVLALSVTERSAKCRSDPANVLEVENRLYRVSSISRGCVDESQDLRTSQHVLTTLGHGKYGLKCRAMLVIYFQSVRRRQTPAEPDRLWHAGECDACLNERLVCFRIDMLAVPLKRQILAAP
ncbi:MAG: hypothetical protein VX528_03360 [Candidatus Latescibacterota bacterium]|nr:hypothetical protein [Candidatus Latescibacterota bacterium]